MGWKKVCLSLLQEREFRGRVETGSRRARERILRAMKAIYKNKRLFERALAETNFNVDTKWSEINRYIELIARPASVLLCTSFSSSGDAHLVLIQRHASST